MTSRYVGNLTPGFLDGTSTDVVYHDKDDRCWMITYLLLCGPCFPLNSNLELSVRLALTPTDYETVVPLRNT